MVPELDSGSNPTIVRNKISESLNTHFREYDDVLMGPVPEFLTPAFADGIPVAVGRLSSVCVHVFAML